MLPTLFSLPTEVLFCMLLPFDASFVGILGRSFLAVVPTSLKNMVNPFLINLPEKEEDRFVPIAI